MASKNGRFPRRRAEIEALPGVGQYVCNAILLFAKAQAAPLLDVNMARVLERCFGPRKLVDIRYDKELQQISHSLVCGPKAKELNWAILDLAASTCIPNSPHCEDCPLCGMCDYNLVRRPS
jgi:A/G-specific adenine glycosylase